MEAVYYPWVQNDVTLIQKHLNLNQNVITILIREMNRVQTTHLGAICTVQAELVKLEQLEEFVYTYQSNIGTGGLKRAGEVEYYQTGGMIGDRSLIAQNSAEGSRDRIIKILGLDAVLDLGYLSSGGFQHSCLLRS